MNIPQNQKVEEGVTRLVRKLVAARDGFVSGPVRRIRRSRSGISTWPILPGAYALGDPLGSVAVCTLTSNDLVAPLAKLPGVAIAGRVYSANLGLEKVVTNVATNPSIRFLLVCGKESPFFQTAQALSCLLSNGMEAGGRILGARGYMPELSQMDPALIERFRQQVELVDCMGETGVQRLAVTIREISSRNPGSYQANFQEMGSPPPSQKNGDGFKPLRLGGHRESLAYDPKGYFIITLDRDANDILVRHYLPNNSPGHFLRGRNGEAILLSLVREGLVTQMSHAGYLGAELAKAETSLRLGLQYEQDRPLSPC
jgi:tetrahydromethanopterin S-methyltransferase subunit A